MYNYYYRCPYYNYVLKLIGRQCDSYNEIMETANMYNASGVSVYITFKPGAGVDGDYFIRATAGDANNFVVLIEKEGGGSQLTVNIKDICTMMGFDTVRGTVPLKLYWSSARGDNFTTATAQGEADAIAAGYPFVRVEGYIYPYQAPGTVPLKLYWSSARGDNFTTATAQGESDAIAAGYSFVRVEGYIYPYQAPGTVPLKLYWSSARGDNFTTATSQGEADAIAAGYSFVRVEGYIYPYQSRVCMGNGGQI